MAWNIHKIVDDLQQIRQEWRIQQKSLKEDGGRELPSRTEIKKIMDDLCGVLFPMRLGPHDLKHQSENVYIAYTLEKTLYALLEQVKLNLAYHYKYKKFEGDSVQINLLAEEIVRDFSAQLPHLRKILDTDVIAAYEGDPAARSVDEVLLCYPGILAMIYHRIAHEFYKKQLSLLARIIAELSHSKTGIDIHPGAQIGQGCFIDHGTGVVIGETCIIGQNVRIYQAVTLGAKRFETDEDGRLQKEYARHPIVQDNVVIYAGATILGRITIGQGAVIGGNVWITQSVEANSFVSQSSLSKL